MSGRPTLILRGYMIQWQTPNTLSGDRHAVHAMRLKTEEAIDVPAFNWISTGTLVSPHEHGELLDRSLKLVHFIFHSRMGRSWLISKCLNPISKPPLRTRAISSHQFHCMYEILRAPWPRNSSVFEPCVGPPFHCWKRSREILGFLSLFTCETASFVFA
jgi:hypothetical protein